MTHVENRGATPSSVSRDDRRVSFPDDNAPVLQARGVTKSFGGFVAVQDLNLDVDRGGVHALIGPNGAGKTTVFNLLTRFIQPTAGQIMLMGEDITRLAPEFVARRGLVRSFQISATFEKLTVSQNIRIALQRPHVDAWRFLGNGADRGRTDARIDELLGSFDLTTYASWRAGDLPYGRKRALELAATMATDPQVMLLDEPTQGLGFEDVERVADLIKAIGTSRTVLMVEHNMSLVSRIADRITVLRSGAIIADGDYATVSRDPQVVEAYLGSGRRRARH
ncbi:ABC transporter ATP-binding protein [Bosea sp. (in: a-proteobacteria)]|uniref:ABC transporter ATP-binding protein n=1 Tax=Bosea sp. (in: a-proteobacteria) TaxID=1871050 RepID=UPI002DDCC0DD|nr:ABC transporter ATP-binding protein [Bosea sp. (in: a-proteobacteria)]HEV2510316.1 ABC transporter ATP-binding protein [Bosea sp. (in: a-proteobacteria)]